MLLASAVLPGLRTAQSATAPPPRLTEAALIAAMEAHGIGTDATVAEHIQKQLERRCDVEPAHCSWVCASYFADASSPLLLLL